LKYVSAGLIYRSCSDNKHRSDHECEGMNKLRFTISSYPLLLQVVVFFFCRSSGKTGE